MCHRTLVDTVYTFTHFNVPIEHFLIIVVGTRRRGIAHESMSVWAVRVVICAGIVSVRGFGVAVTITATMMIVTPTTVIWALSVNAYFS